MIHRSKCKSVLTAATVVFIFAAGADAAHAADQELQPAEVAALRKAGNDAEYWAKAARDCARAARELRVPGEEEAGEADAARLLVLRLLRLMQAGQTPTRDEVASLTRDAREKAEVAQEAFAECNLRRLAQEFDADREPLGVTRGGSLGGGGGGGGGGHPADAGGDDTGADGE